MHPSKFPRLALFLACIASLSLACNAGSLIPGIPSIPTSIPTPADFGTPTGSSPASGDWSAKTDFGKIAFTIDPDGKTLVDIYVELHNWTCGGVTATTGIQATNDPPASVENGSFGMSVTLDPEDPGHHNEELYVSGTYDDANKKFSGKWEENAYGTICTGTWETASRP